MSGFTPGPWEVREVHPGRSNTPILQVAIGPKGTPSICEITRGTRPFSERAANARLIAAAPDLLEALVDARWQLYEERHATMSEEQFIRSVRDIDAAISKAEGR